METDIEELYEIIEEIEYDKYLAYIERKNRENKRKNKKKKNIKIKSLCIDTLCYVLTSAFVVVSLNTYRPHKDEVDGSNIYSGRNLIISDDEIDDLKFKIEQELDIFIDEEEIDNYLVLDSVIKNEELTEEEKSVCYEFYPMIRDNIYLDKERAYESLLNIDVDYKLRPFWLECNVEGVYIDSYDSIGIFVKDSDNRVLRHEFIHCLFNCKNLPSTFEEGMNELLSNEYFSDDPFVEMINYPYETIYIKMLCEIVGADKVLKAYSTDNMECIYRMMDNILGTDGDACELLTQIDELFNNSYCDIYKKHYEEFSLAFDKLKIYMDKRCENTNDFDGLYYYWYYDTLMRTLENSSYYSDYFDLVDIYSENHGKLYFSKDREKSLVKNN